MQLRAIFRIAAVTLAASILSACDRTSRDVGADMAACDLEEFKSSYSSKTRNWQEMKAVTEEASQAQDAAVYKEVFDNIWNALKQDRKKFIALCMRARGWQLRSGQGERSTDCILDHFDQANCYEPATPAA
jgi:predicted small secreted protein